MFGPPLTEKNVMTNDLPCLQNVKGHWTEILDADYLAIGTR